MPHRKIKLGHTSVLLIGKNKEDIDRESNPNNIPMQLLNEGFEPESDYLEPESDYLEPEPVHHIKSTTLPANSRRYEYRGSVKAEHKRKASDGALKGIDKV